MRDTGPIRKDFGLEGDTEASAAYMGVARTQLGILKNQMQFNKLLQGSRTVQLEDGTRIQVSSRFGQDTVRVLTPAAPQVSGGVLPGVPVAENVVPTAEQPNLTVPTSGRFMAVGIASDITTFYAIVWHNSREFVDIGMPPGVLAGAVNINQLLGLSRDGYAVGTAGINGAYIPYLWTKTHGYHVLGNLGTGDIAALGVSSGGRVVVGRARLGLGASDRYQPVYWTARTGWVVLSNAGRDGDCAVNGVSDNGEFATGYVGTVHYSDPGPGGVVTESQTQEPAFWSLRDGSVSIILSANNSVAAGNGVANNGAAVGTFWSPPASPMWYYRAPGGGVSQYSAQWGGDSGHGFYQGLTCIDANGTLLAGGLPVSDGSITYAVLGDPAGNVRAIGQGNISCLSARGDMAGGIDDNRQAIIWDLRGGGAAPTNYPVPTSIGTVRGVTLEATI